MLDSLLSTNASIKSGDAKAGETVSLMAAELIQEQ